MAARKKSTRKSAGSSRSGTRSSPRRSTTGSTSKSKGRSSARSTSSTRPTSKSRTASNQLEKLHQGGIEAYRKGDLEKAIQLLEQVVEQDPQSAAALCNLGTVLKVHGEIDKAKDCYTRALAIVPEEPDILLKLGNLYSSQDYLNEAAACFEKVIVKRPKSEDAHNNLAAVYLRLGQYEKARGHIESTIQLNPNLAHAHCNLAKVLDHLGEADRAVSHLKKAVELDSVFTDAYLTLAGIYADTGDFHLAMDILRKVIAINPSLPDAYYLIAIKLRELLTEDEMQALHRLVSNKQLNLLERARLHTALGAAHDTRTEYEAASKQFETANTIVSEVYRRHGDDYDPANHAKIVDQIIEAYTPEYLNKAARFGLDTIKPVFVVGFPRSGTTLLEQVLDSHPLVHGAGELMIIPQAFDHLPARLHRSHLTPVQCIMNGKLKRDGQKLLAGDILDTYCKLAPQAKYVIDKMPDNYHFVGFIHSLFPKAKIIHCIRNPRDIALSCWTSDFSGIRWASRPEHIAARLQNYRRLMTHWRNLLPYDILIDCYYEQFIEMPAPAFERIFQYLGLTWDDSLLEFHKRKRTVKTASTGQVHKPLYRHAMQRWRKYAPYMPWLAKVIPDYESPYEMNTAA